MMTTENAGKPAREPSLHRKQKLRSFGHHAPSVFVDDKSAQRSVPRNAASHIQSSRSPALRGPVREESIPVERPSSRSGVQPYADGFSENPLTGSPATGVTPFKYKLAAETLQAPTGDGECPSLRGSRSCEALIERPVEQIPMRKESRSIAHKLSAEALKVSHAYQPKGFDQILRETARYHEQASNFRAMQQPAWRGQPAQGIAAAQRPGMIHTLQTLEEPLRPVSRDTHKIVVGSEDDHGGITDTVRSTASEGRSSKLTVLTGIPPNGNPAHSNRNRSLRSAVSFEAFVARLPLPTGHAQTGKSYVPAFLKPGVKATHRPVPKTEGSDSPSNSGPAASSETKVKSAAKQDKAGVPAFLKPGWGEMRRKPPRIGKSNAAATTTSSINQHHYELHLGGSVPENDRRSLDDEPASEKMKSMRRAWDRAWKKRNQYAESSTEPAADDAQKRQARILTAVALAQSGPASIVAGPVFPAEIVVTPSPGKSYRPEGLLGDAKVSVKDLPSMLRPGHSSIAIGGEQDANSPTYKWPLVDLTNELFLNFDPKKDNGVNGHARGLKHQEPRIVSIEFPKDGLHDEVLHDLAKRQRENRTAKSRPTSETGFEVNVDVESPISPLSAGTSGIATEIVIGGRGLTTFKAREVQIGTRHNLSRSEMVEIRSQEATLPVGQSALDSIFTVSNPKQDALAKEPDQPDFNWFRFSRVDLEDPADEHCRGYRNRRREMRKSKQEAWLAHERRGIDDRDGIYGRSSVRDPEQSWLAL
jgi:hypothetical protein